MRRALITLTLGFCAVAMVAALWLEGEWLRRIGPDSSLRENLPLLWALDLPPLGVYSLAALFGRRAGVAAAACACAGLALGAWLLALPPPPADAPDPEEWVGMNCFVVGVFQWVLALPLGLAALVAGNSRHP